MRGRNSPPFLEERARINAVVARVRESGDGQEESFFSRIRDRFRR